MRSSIVILFPLLLFMLLVDVYTWRGIKPLVARIGYSWARKSLALLFWGITGLIFTAFVVFTFGIRSVKQSDAYVYVGWLLIGFTLFYIPKFVFIFFVLANDIGRALRFIIRRFKKQKKEHHVTKGMEKKIRRSEFLYQAGLVLAAIPFGSVLYGVTLGKFNFRILNEQLRFSRLPKSFRGLKIVQISDLHLGSFNKNFEPVEAAVEMINEQDADLIFFTGDLVNNFSEETEGWAPVLSKMKAKIGKYSIMGNHDYGDYSRWGSQEAKAENLSKIKSFHEKIGFQLLLNEAKNISIDGEEITVIGVENWGQPPFPQYGNLKKATSNVNPQSFKILLSHDPTHWDAEVLGKSDIELTFSGHTHGMQFGIETAGIKWSPAKYKYPRWGGLYREENQFLYVNRGFGVIGFPGRIGMPPEITVVELF